MNSFPPDATASPSSHLDDVHSLYDTWREIEAVKERIKQTMEVIERANASLQDLRALETELLDTAKAKASSLSPFKKLSGDNISEIVGHLTSFSVTLGNINHSIWPMTHVCSSWRQIILSLPHLWSSFSIYHDVPLEMVLAVLERSRSHPLSLYFRTGPEITSLLVNHSERWKDADIDICPDSAIFLRLRGRLALLESLKLRTEFSNPSHDWTDSEEERSIFEDAPSLSKLDLTHFSRNFPVQFRFPVKQLVHYLSNWRVSSTGVASWQLDDLSSFSKLSHLSLTNSRSRPVLGSLSRVPIELPSVSHLRLDYGLEPLAIIVSPSLTDLELRDIKVNHDSLAILRTFLSSVPQNRLNTFSLTMSPNQSVNRCIQALLAHPGLRHVHTLSLEEGIRDQTVFGELPASPWVEWFLDSSTFYIPKQPIYISGTEPHILLPNLRNFSLRYDHQSTDGTGLSALLDFVVSRTSLIDELEDGNRHGDSNLQSGNLHIPPRLEAICIRYCPFLKPITLANFHRLEARLVELRYPGEGIYSELVF